MKIIQKFTILLVILALLTPGLLLAAPDDGPCSGYTQCYQVEIIVFQAPSAQALQSERWPSHPALPQTRNAIDLLAGKNSSTIPSLDPSTRKMTPPGYRLLPRSYFKLNEQAWALKAKAHYPILLHMAWQQPLLSPRYAKPIHIYADPLNRSAFNNLSSNEYWRLNGTVTLSKSGLINIASNLVLNVPVHELTPAIKQTAFAQRNIASFRLLQRRRMRPNEVHYFDHPLFGMLVEVTPIKKAI